MGFIYQFIIWKLPYISLPLDKLYLFHRNRVMERFGLEGILNFLSNGDFLGKDVGTGFPKHN